MALLKKGFKKFGHEDVRTEYFALDTTDHLQPDNTNADLVAGPLKSKKCFPAGSVIKFDGTSKKAVSAVETDDNDTNDLTNAKINNTVFLLAEDFYSDDNGFVYYIVDNTNNLEDRA